MTSDLSYCSSHPTDLRQPIHASLICCVPQPRLFELLLQPRLVLRQTRGVRACAVQLTVQEFSTAAGGGQLLALEQANIMQYRQGGHGLELPK